MTNKQNIIKFGENIYEALNGNYPTRNYIPLKDKIFFINSYTPKGINLSYTTFKDPYELSWEEGIEAMVLLPTEKGYATLTNIHKSLSIIEYSPEGIKALEYAISKEFKEPIATIYNKNRLLAGAVLFSGERVKLFPEYREEILEGLEKIHWDLKLPRRSGCGPQIKIEPIENITTPSEPWNKGFYPSRKGRYFQSYNQKGKNKIIYRSPDEDWSLSNLAYNIRQIGGNFLKDKELIKKYFQIAKKVHENMISEKSWNPILEYLTEHSPDIAKELSLQIENPNNKVDHVSILNIPLNRSSLSNKIEESLR